MLNAIEERIVDTTTMVALRIHQRHFVAPHLEVSPHAPPAVRALAPSGYGKDRGFMMRIFFPLNETDAPYPPGGAPEDSASRGGRGGSRGQGGSL